MLVGGAVLSIAVVSAGSLGIAAAANNKSTDSNSIVDKIADKFGLKKDDVQKVFDENRQAKQAEHEVKAKDRLNQLVKDGKLTQDQADKLTAKAEELKAEHEANKDKFKDLTPEERKDQMDKKITELRTWLKDNGIDEKYIWTILGAGGHGPGGMSGHNGSGKMGMMPN